MRANNILITVSTAIALGILGAASTALAGNDRDETGGFRIGPFGQLMGGPSGWGAKGAFTGANAYGLVPAGQKGHASHRKTKAR